MNHELEYKLWATGQDAEHSLATWGTIVDALLDDFSLFINSYFERDPEFTCEPHPPSPSFTRWIWTPLDLSSSPFSIGWSGVIAGNVVETSAGEEFQVTLDLFLFDTTNRKRICTSEGESYLQFVFRRPSSGVAGWQCLGWRTDEWGEWEGLQFPKEP